MNFLMQSMDEVTWSYIVFVLASLPWVSYAFMIMFFSISIFYGRMKMHHVADHRNISDEMPGVSILKPLMGVDPFLESNLESHFSIDYPKFEVLVCVADEQDPAIAVVERIRERYPKVDCRLFTGGQDGIINPLVHNLAPAYDAAKYDVIWISTSRIKASSEILLDMVTRMGTSNKVGLVHQLPFTTDQSGFAAAVEKVYFGATITKYYLAFHVLGISCFTGMSYLIRKTHLDDVKGLTFFGRYLAEDFFLAKYLHNNGYKHQVAAIPAQQNVASTSIAAYKDRMVRWLRLRLNMMPVTASILEPMGESLPLGIYAAWSAFYLFGVNPYYWFAGHWLVWFTLDYIQLRSIQSGPLPFSFVTYTLAWLVRELLYVLVYVEAVCNVRRVKWGRRTYRLSNCGETLQIDSDKSLLTV